MRSLLLTLLLVPALASSQAAVPVPRLLPYQGRLLKTDGTPEAGTPRLTFRIYDAPAGGAARWTESQTTTVRNGFYAVFLGNDTAFPDDLFDGHDRWLAVAIDDGAELTPRQQIASVAYAITATNAFRATSADRALTADRAAVATRADSAASADQADQADRAQSAASADYTDRAGEANTANEVTGGRVRASTILATGDIRTTGGLSATSITTGAISGDTVTAGGLTVTGNASVRDLVITGTLTGGGIRVIGGAYEYLSGNSQERWSCDRWGEAQCNPDWSSYCLAGDHIMVSEGGCWFTSPTRDDNGYCRQYFCIEGLR